MQNPYLAHLKMPENVPLPALVLETRDTKEYGSGSISAAQVRIYSLFFYFEVSLTVETVQRGKDRSRTNNWLFALV